MCCAVVRRCGLSLLRFHTIWSDLILGIYEVRRQLWISWRGLEFCRWHSFIHSLILCDTYIPGFESEIDWLRDSELERLIEIYSSESPSSSWYQYWMVRTAFNTNTLLLIPTPIPSPIPSPIYHHPPIAITIFPTPRLVKINLSLGKISTSKISDRSSSVPSV